MSYTNSTTHYGIPLPTQTDLVNGLDWNTSSEAIDTAIYSAAQAAETAAGDIVDIKGDVADLKQADTQFGQDLLEVTGRVSTLEQNATLDEDAIQDAFDMITDKEVTQAQSDVPVALNEWFRYNGTLYVATQAINIGDTIIPNTNCRATNIEDEMPTSGAISASGVTYDNTTSQLSADDVQEAIDELKGLIDQIGGNSMKKVTRYAVSSGTLSGSGTASITQNLDAAVDLTKTTITGIAPYGYDDSTGHIDQNYLYSIKSISTTDFVVEFKNTGSTPHSFSVIIEVCEYN